MLSHDATTSPKRPRPPALLRRNHGSSDKSMEKLPPPPPYHPTTPSLAFPQHRTMSITSMDSKVASPVSATAQLLGIDLNQQQEGGGLISGDYVSEKSRDELEKLLLKADAVIRAREKELGVAAAVGKQLLDANMQLRQRHTSLLSKYTAGAQNPTPSNLAFPGPEGSPWATDDTPKTPAPNPNPRTPKASLTARSPGHGRKPSASPQALAALSAHNTDLLSQLQTIQEDTSRANLEGKRKLRGLEKEISGLRAELELARQRNGELEEKIEKTEHEKELEAKKLERELRLRALKEAASPAPKKDDVRDYAPAHPFATSTPNPGRTPRKRPSREIRVDKKSLNQLGLNLPGQSSQSSGSRPVSASEYTIISQLMSKIEELENANLEMMQQNQATDDVLRRASQNAESIRRVYDTLEDEADDADVELDDDFGISSLAASTSNRALKPPEDKRHRALRERRSTPQIRSKGMKSPNLKSATMKSPPMKSPIHLGTPLALASPIALHRPIKNRRALTENLFRTPDDTGIEGEEEDEDFPLLSHPSSSGSNQSAPHLRFESASPEVEDGDQKFTQMPLSPKRLLRSAISSPSLQGRFHADKVASPGVPDSAMSLSLALSTIHSVPGSTPEPSPIRRSLESELGSEFGGDWGSGEARASFILTEDEGDGLFQFKHSPQEDERSGVDESGSPSKQLTLAAPVEENAAMVALRNALDPRNHGKLLGPDEHILPLGSLAGTPGESFFLLDYAVKARPNAWRGPNAERVRMITHSSQRELRALPSASDATEAATPKVPTKKLVDPWEDKYDEGSMVEESELEFISPLSTHSKGKPWKESRTPDSRSGSLRRAAAKGRLERDAHQRLRIHPKIETYPEEDEEDEAQLVRKRSRRELQSSSHEDRVEKNNLYNNNNVAGQLGRTIVELWILLQAVIIMVVFVYSMARRGPRAILDAAEVRRPK